MSVRALRCRCIAFALCVICAGYAGGIAVAHVTVGRWGRLTSPPATPEEQPVSVWTGHLMVVFSRRHLPPTPRYPVVGRNVNLAMAYNPGVDRWRRLSSVPPGPSGSAQGDTKLVWTGSEVLFWGVTNGALDPVSNRWRSLPASPLRGRYGAGIVVWTGREMIGWGGGCCGDAFSDGAAYNPATNRWRMLPRAPLAGSQRPAGSWDGHELLLFVGARGAAYNPTSNSWRRIAPLPAGAVSEQAVWDAHELLVLGGAGVRSSSGWPASRRVFAYDPATNHWRRLASMESGRTGAAAVWAGKLLLVWGGRTAVEPPFASENGATPRTGSPMTRLATRGLRFHPPRFSDAAIRRRSGPGI